MIAVTYTATHIVRGKEVLSMERRVVSDRIDEGLAADVLSLLAGAFRPVRGDEELQLLVTAQPRHSALGVDTFLVRHRALRRAAERLWPADIPTPGVDRKAAFLLLTHRFCVVRSSPFTGLVVNRT